MRSQLNAAGVMRSQQQHWRCCGVCSQAGTFQHDGVHLGVSRRVGKDVAADDVASAVTTDLETDSSKVTRCAAMRVAFMQMGIDALTA